MVTVYLAGAAADEDLKRDIIWPLQEQSENSPFLSSFGTSDIVLVQVLAIHRYILYRNFVSLC